MMRSEYVPGACALTRLLRARTTARGVRPLAGMLSALLCGMMALAAWPAGVALAQRAAPSAAAFQAPADWWVNIANDRAERIRADLARGADPNLSTAEGQPSVMQAIQDEAWQVYDLLVKQPRLLVDAVNANRESPLMYLAVVGQTARARALIARGASVNRPEWTPLHYAASRGHVDTARLFIEHRADVNARAPDGTTPLMMAAFSGSEAVVQLLLSHGAQLDLRDGRGNQAADWARQRLHNRLAGKLEALAVRQAQPAVVQPPPAQQAKPAEDLSNTSRYFNLDRDFSDIQP